MTFKEVAGMLSTVGIPYAYNQFEEADNMSPPFICFLFTGSSDFIADNVNYQAIRSLSIELYTDDKDFELEQRVEDILTAHELPFVKEETYLDSERMFMIVFRADIIITQEAENG